MEKLSEYQAKEKAKAAVWIVVTNTIIILTSHIAGNTGNGQSSKEGRGFVEMMEKYSRS